MRAVVRPGAAATLRAHLDDLGAQRVLLVTGGASYASSGAQAVLESQLAGLTVARHRCATDNPTLEGAVAAAATLTRLAPDVVVACGGGTPMDTAKLALAFAAHDPGQVIARRVVPAAPCPLVAIPTTAGTGSEATHFAVVYVDGVKHSVAGPTLRPTLALVDPELTATLPPAVTATSGLDALTQAIESHWAVRADDASRAHSRSALALLVPNLATAVRAPTPQVRAAMAEGALHSGRGIDHTFTTACHALSYHLTSAHGVAHGHAVALTLGPVLRFNARVSPTDALAEADVTRAAIGEIAAAFGVADADQAAAAITQLIADVGLATTLAGVGCTTSAQRLALVDAVNVERLANNPRRMRRADLVAIVDAVA